MKVVGIDCSLLNVGIVVGDYNERSRKLVITHIEHLHYKRPKKNKSLSDAAHVKTVNRRLTELCKGAKLVSAELPYGSQSSQAAWGLGIALGTVASLQHDIHWVTPNAVKKHTNNYTKADMITWAIKNYPDLPWPKYRGRVAKRAEHIADAVGVLHTTLNI